MRRIGTVTRRVRRVGQWKAAVNVSGMEVLRPWDDDGLGRVFDALAGRLCGGGGAEFISLCGRDTQLWAQGIVTLAVLGSMTGVTEAACGMRGDVVEIAVSQVLGSEAEADVVVRRGCALALGAVVEAMTDGEVRGRVVGGVVSGEVAGMGIGMGATVGLGELFGGGGGGGDIGEGDIAAVGRAGDWLQEAARGDSDVGVRRFAARALRIWAHRVERSA